MHYCSTENKSGGIRYARVVIKVTLTSRQPLAQSLEEQDEVTSAVPSSISTKSGATFTCVQGNRDKKVQNDK